MIYFLPKISGDSEDWIIQPKRIIQPSLLIKNQFKFRICIQPRCNFIYYQKMIQRLRTYRKSWRLLVLCIYSISIILNFTIGRSLYGGHHEKLWMFAHGRLLYLTHINMVKNLLNYFFNKIIKFSIF
jgi:hypothetical protein